MSAKLFVSLNSKSVDDCWEERLTAAAINPNVVPSLTNPCAGQMEVGIGSLNDPGACSLINISLLAHHDNITHKVTTIRHQLGQAERARGRGGGEGDVRCNTRETEDPNDPPSSQHPQKGRESQKAQRDETEW